jgi:hypothetical protein
MREHDYKVRIGPGVQVIYHDDGVLTAGSVTAVHREQREIEVRGVPGVLRMQDIQAVGVYADEAEFELSPVSDNGDESRIADSNSASEEIDNG